MASASAFRATPRIDPTLALHERSGPFVEGDEIANSQTSGDITGPPASRVELLGCRLAGAQLTGGHLRRSRLIDCIVSGCDLSGVILDDCTCARVEFREIGRAHV